MGPFAARMNRRFRDAAGDVPATSSSGSRRGPVPEDLQLRQAARRVALQQREQLVRQRRWVLPLLGLLAAFVVWSDLRDGESSASSWLVVASVLVFLVAHLLMARRLARRAEMLAGPPA